PRRALLKVRACGRTHQQSHPLLAAREMKPALNRHRQHPWLLQISPTQKNQRTPPRWQERLQRGNLAPLNTPPILLLEAQGPTGPGAPEVAGVPRRVHISARNPHSRLSLKTYPRRTPMLNPPSASRKVATSKMATSSLKP